MAGQEKAGKQFSEEQRWWLDRIATTIGLNLRFLPDDFDNDGEFFNRGGRWGARDVLGEEWMELLHEMNQVLVV